MRRNPVNSLTNRGISTKHEKASVYNQRRKIDKHNLPPWMKTMHFENLEGEDVEEQCIWERKEFTLVGKFDSILYPRFFIRLTEV